MRVFLKKLFQMSILHTLSLIISITILFSIAYAAISRPGSNPSWETAWWKFMQYFDKIFNVCPNWKVLLWYNDDKTIKCWEVWTNLIKDDSLTLSDIDQWSFDSRYFNNFSLDHWFTSNVCGMTSFSYFKDSSSWKFHSSNSICFLTAVDDDSVTPLSWVYECQLRISSWYWQYKFAWDCGDVNCQARCIRFNIG